VISGGITLGYLPPVEESAIFEDVEDVLVDNYDGGIIADDYDDIVALVFLGFTESDDGSGPNAIIIEPKGETGASRGVIAGAAVVSAAVVALLVLLLLLIRRRRNTSTTRYLSQHNLDEKEEDSTGSEEDSIIVPIVPADSSIVPDMSMEVTLSTATEDKNKAKQDVKVCDSAFCPSCRGPGAEGPVFIPCPVAGEESIEEDTSDPEIQSVESDSKHTSSSTQDL
jgi:hypothetical protein